MRPRRPTSSAATKPKRPSGRKSIARQSSIQSRQERIARLAEARKKRASTGKPKSAAQTAAAERRAKMQEERKAKLAQRSAANKARLEKTAQRADRKQTRKSTGRNSKADAARAPGKFSRRAR